MLRAKHGSQVHSEKKHSHRNRFTRPEWLGQTVASLGWIASVLIDEIDSGGDWLQLMAASAWFLSNIAAAATPSATNRLGSDDHQK
ncbi:MAG: hypothetical protein AAGA91_07500 [Pseudomonadota bacterium]